MSLLITCEHAGNLVPDAYQPLFVEADAVLQSHRGWDPGAKDLALHLAEALKAPLRYCDTSRLLIEPNRSLGSPQLFSEFTRSLNSIEKEKLLNAFYFPYRRGVEEAIMAMEKPVFHFSIHTFTPVWNGVPRPVDIGLLFDPERNLETGLCSRLQSMLLQESGHYNVPFNEPYKGIDDGLTTYLRTKFRDVEYAGIEIEVNQKYAGNAQWRPIAEALVRAFRSLR